MSARACVASPCLCGALEPFRVGPWIVSSIRVDAPERVDVYDHERLSPSAEMSTRTGRRRLGEILGRNSSSCRRVLAGRQIESEHGKTGPLSGRLSRVRFYASAVRQCILMAAAYALLVIAVIVLLQVAFGTFRLRK